MHSTTLGSSPMQHASLAGICWASAGKGSHCTATASPWGGGEL